MRRLFAVCALVLLADAPAAAQQFPPAQVGPHLQLQAVPPNLNGTWEVAVPVPAQLTLRPQANGVMSGNLWPHGLFNNVRFPCSGQYSDTAYTFVVLCRSQQLRAIIVAGRGEAQGVNQTRLHGNFYQPIGGDPPGRLTSSPFEGTPVP